MKFHKMNGAGNDYIYFNCLDKSIEDIEALTVMVSDRHTGIGSDGAIFICKSDRADAEMRIYNADGSYAEMCGNGIRCVAKYLYDMAIVDKTEMVIESGGELKYITINTKEEKANPVTGKTYSKRADKMVAGTIRVDMGCPILKPEDIPVCIPGFAKESVISEAIIVDGKEYKMTCVSVGNPHCVVFVDETDDFPVVEIGKKFEYHSYFPKRINTEFVKVINRAEVSMRVSERGAGETMACGTGATASVIACVLNGYTDNEVTIHLLGGDLVIKWDKETNRVYMTGPAEFVCEGDI